MKIIKKNQKIVASCVIENNGRILLVGRTDKIPDNKNQWGLISSTPENGESLIDAAIREISKETGLRENDIEFLKRGKPIEIESEGKNLIIHPHHFKSKSSKINLKNKNFQYEWILRKDIGKKNTLFKTEEIIDAALEDDRRLPVGAICVLQYGTKILILKRSRWVDFSQGKWSTVAGRLEENEQPLEGAARELIEELGLDAKKFKLIKEAEPFKMVEDDIQYTSYPFLFELTGNKVNIDWEHEEAKLINPSEIENYDIEPFALKSIKIFFGPVV